MATVNEQSKNGIPSTKPESELSIASSSAGEGNAITATASDMNGSSTTATASSSASAGLSKKQRGRLKKLRKRGLVLRTDTDLSGISKREEWKELQEMIALEQQEKDCTNSQQQQLQNFYPWIGYRTSKKQQLQKEDRIVESADHRMILKRLHCQTPPRTDVSDSKNSNKKRERNDDGSREENLTIPPWAVLHNSACVDHLAILEIHVANEQLSLEDIERTITDTDRSVEPIMTRWFQGPQPQSISDSLLYEKPNNNNHQRSKKKSKDRGCQCLGMEAIFKNLQSLTLTPEQWKEEGYPVIDEESTEQKAKGRSVEIESCPSFRTPASFTLEEAQEIVEESQVVVMEQQCPFVSQLKDTPGSHELPRIFGMDCEMVKTGIGTELARVTLVQYIGESSTGTFADSYEVLMDELVLSENIILDYVTEYSGMTPELLSTVKLRLEQVQACLLHYVRRHDIVIGHSLENDLMACRWVHPNVVDTAVLFRRSSNSFKHSLKHLSNVLLQKKIQEGSHHCSVEDTVAALELAIRRAKEGESFAIYSREKQWWIQSKKGDHAPCVFVGPSQWLQSHVTKHPNGFHALACESIDQPNRKAIASWLTGPKRRAGLVWGNLIVKSQEHVTCLKDILSDLRMKISSSTVLMVATQQGYDHAFIMARARRIAQDPRTTMGWSEEQERAFLEANEKCRTGKVFWITKHGGAHNETVDTDKEKGNHKLPPRNAVK